MSEFVITPKDELEKMLRALISEMFKSPVMNLEMEGEERLNQKEAAAYLGVTQSTLIRWKKNGLVPVEQLPGSTKVTYYKSQLKSIIQRNPSLLQAARK